MRTLKTTIRILLLSGMLSPLSLFTSCSTTNDGSYSAPISLYEKVSGKWVLNTITQTDASTTQTMPLTSVLNFDTFVINLNVDSKNNPTTFTVDGNAPQLLPTSGTWTLDYPFTHSDNTASQITLISNGGITKLIVSGVPGTNPNLEYRLTRTINGQAYVSYTYNLMATVK